MSEEKLTQEEAERCGARFLDACQKLRVAPPALFVVDKVGIEVVIRVGGPFVEADDGRLLFDLVRGEPMVGQLQRVCAAGPWEPHRDGLPNRLARYNVVTGREVASVWRAGAPEGAPPLYRWATEDGHENTVGTSEEASYSADEVLKRSRHRWKLAPGLSLVPTGATPDPSPLGRGWLFRTGAKLETPSYQGDE